MSDATMTLGPSEPSTAVHLYVARVREALADLPADDIDELTGGLEADLAERLADAPGSGDLTAELGPPERYAAELREAAGLPPRAAQGRSRPDLEGWLRRTHERLVERLPWLADLRPAWWLGRGALLGAAVSLVLGLWLPFLVLAAIGAAVSFWLGRRWRGVATGSAANRLSLAANAAAAVALLPALAVVVGLPGWFATTTYVDPPMVAQPATDGVWVNGEPATNLYAYDAQGNRIDRVRLFNQYGQAVEVTPDALYDAIARTDPTGNTPLDPSVVDTMVRSVFPLRFGDRTGWEASLGRWEPSVQISPLTADPSPSASGPPSPASSSAATSASTPATPTTTTTPTTPATP